MDGMDGMYDVKNICLFVCPKSGEPKRTKKKEKGSKGKTIDTHTLSLNPREKEWRVVRPKGGEIKKIKESNSQNRQIMASKVGSGQVRRRTCKETACPCRFVCAG